jgi:hypothetical protein
MRFQLHRRARQMRAFFCAAAALLLPASADELVWSFGAASPFSDVPDAAAANLTVSPMTRGNEGGTSTMLSSTSASVTTGPPAVPEYAGASGAGNAQVACKTGAFDAGTSTYYQFTLTPEAGYNLNITEVTFGTRRTGTGPVNYSLRQSADGYATAIAAGAAPAASTWGLISHPGLSFTAPGAVTLRLYGHDGTGTVSAANWRIDDLKITLTVTVNGAPPPVITDFSPQSGTPGTLVTITGAEFGAAPVVRFNGTIGTGTSVNPEGTSIITTVPAAATTGPLTVNGPGGQATGPLNFTVVPLPQLSVSAAPSTFAENAANPASFGTVTLPEPLGFDFTVTRPAECRYSRRTEQRYF